MKSSNTLTIILVALIVVAGAGGFYGGMQYQKSKAPANPFAAGAGTFRQRFGNVNGRGFGLLGGRGGVRGQVKSISGSTMTVTLANGNSTVVILSGSTTVDKSVTAATTDIAAGDTVAVSGTPNSDGSVTATTVQLNPPALTTPAGVAPTSTNGA